MRSYGLHDRSTSEPNHVLLAPPNKGLGKRLKEIYHRRVAMRASFQMLKGSSEDSKILEGCINEADRFFNLRMGQHQSGKSRTIFCLNPRIQQNTYRVVEEPNALVFPATTTGFSRAASESVLMSRLGVNVTTPAVVHVMPKDSLVIPDAASGFVPSLWLTLKPNWKLSQRDLLSAFSLLSVRPSVAVETAAGFEIHWRLNRLIPASELERCLKRVRGILFDEDMQKAIAGEPLRQEFAVPGCMKWSNGSPFLATIAMENPEVELDVDALLA